MLKEMICNLCGSNNYTIMYKNYNGGDIEIEAKSYDITEHSTNFSLRIVKCRKCGLIYANPRPSDKRLAHNYTNMVSEEYLKEELGRRLASKPILKMLKKFKAGGRMLEIGCATGFFLDEARKAGWQVCGVELSRRAAEYAKNRLVIENVFQGVLKNADYPDDYFDAVIMKDTIEHLIDPKDTLREIRRILKPHGMLYVNTPNISSMISKALKAKWWGVNQAHLYYFNRKSLLNMLHIAGFVPKKTGSYTRVFSLSYWASKLKNYNIILYRVFTFFMRHNSMKDNLLRINLGDQIEVYAVKSKDMFQPSLSTKSDRSF